MGKRHKNKVHIGEAIKKILDERNMSVTSFASAISYSRENIYHLFKRQAIESDTIAKISVILNYDFMSLYYEDDGRKPDKVMPNEEVEQHDKTNYIINLQLDLKKMHHVKIFNEFMQGNNVKLR